MIDLLFGLLFGVPLVVVALLTVATLAYGLLRVLLDTLTRP